MLPLWFSVKPVPVFQKCIAFANPDCMQVPSKCLLQALKTIEKKGLNAMAREAGLDLSKLPYTVVSKNRLEYLASRESAPPMPRKIAVRRMQNPEKLAASKKKPLVAKYLLGNRVYLTRDE